MVTFRRAIVVSRLVNADVETSNRSGSVAKCAESTALSVDTAVCLPLKVVRPSVNVVTATARKPQLELPISASTLVTKVTQNREMKSVQRLATVVVAQTTTLSTARRRPILCVVLVVLRLPCRVELRRWVDRKSAAQWECVTRSSTASPLVVELKVRLCADA